MMQLARNQAHLSLYLNVFAQGILQVCYVFFLILRKQGVANEGFRWVFGALTNIEDEALPKQLTVYICLYIFVCLAPLYEYFYTSPLYDCVNSNPHLLFCEFNPTLGRCKMITPDHSQNLKRRCVCIYYKDSLHIRSPNYQYIDSVQLLSFQSRKKFFCTLYRSRAQTDRTFQEACQRTRTR